MRSNTYKWYLAANVPLTVGYFALPQYHLWLWAALGASAAAAVVVGTLRNRPRRALPWLLVAMALASFAAGCSG